MHTELPDNLTARNTHAYETGMRARLIRCVFLYVRVQARVRLCVTPHDCPGVEAVDPARGGVDGAVGHPVEQESHLVHARCAVSELERESMETEGRSGAKCAGEMRGLGGKKGRGKGDGNRERGCVVGEQSPQSAFERFKGTGEEEEEHNIQGARPLS